MGALALPSPKAVIFDWDNTLVNTWPIIHAALEATFKEMGQKPWTYEQTVSRVKKSMRDSFPEIFGEGWEKAGESYQAHYRATHLEMLEALPQAEEVLKRVRDLGLYSAVVSNKKGVNLRKEITHLNWDDYFDAIVGSDDAARDKPHADPVHLAFDQSPVKPGRHVWFIGDSEIDLECAQISGCTAILYGTLVKDQPSYTGTHFCGFPYQAHVHSHEETLAMLG